MTDSKWHVRPKIPHNLLVIITDNYLFFLCSSLQPEWGPAVETIPLHPEWSTPLTSLTSTGLAVFATGLSRSLDLPPSSSTSPSLTSQTRQTWWSYWTATPTRWWRASTGVARRESWWMSQATSSYCTSTQTAPTRPRDLLCFTKVRFCLLLVYVVRKVLAVLCQKNVFVKCVKVAD